MSIIRVYDPNERNFDNNGIKILKPLRADIVENLNGDYFLEIEDIIENSKFYQQDYIIRIKTPNRDYQCFRISNPKPKNKRISCKAWHLFYDSKRYMISDSYVDNKNCNDALDHLNRACDTETPFTTISDIPGINSYRCVRKDFQTANLEVLNRWGGYLVRDNWNIAIRNEIGQDRGVVLSDNKNIENMEKEEIWDNVCTKILPYTVYEQKVITLDPEYLISEIQYNQPYTKSIKFENDLEKLEDESEEDFIERIKIWLTNEAKKYLLDHSVPEINYKLSAHLKDIAGVGDTIYVRHKKCIVDITTRVISTKFDCISGKYKSIEFGNFKKELKTLMNEVSNVAQEIAEQKTLQTKATLEEELNEATNKINNVLGQGYVIKEQNQILVVDKLPKETATYVIKINYAGIGFSNNGINGNFNSVWSINGTLDMQNINVINLTANMIKGGILKLGSALNENGAFELYDESNTLIGKMDKDGLVMYGKDGSSIKVNPEVAFSGYDFQGNRTFWADGQEFHQKKSFVEEDITIGYKIRFLPITRIDHETEEVLNDGAGLVPLVNGGEI